MTRPEPPIRLIPISLNRSRYRSGRWVVVAQGVAYVVLGAVAWLRATSAPHEDPSVAGLHISGALGTALIVLGVVTVLASARRRTAVIVMAFGSAVGLAMVIVCAVASVHHASSPMGFDPTDILLFGLMGAFSLGLLMWLCPDTVEGRVWRYRPVRPERHSPPHQ